MLRRGFLSEGPTARGPGLVCGAASDGHYSSGGGVLPEVQDQPKPGVGTESTWYV